MNGILWHLSTKLMQINVQKAFHIFKENHLAFFKIISIFFFLSVCMAIINRICFLNSKISSIQSHSFISIFSADNNCFDLITCIPNFLSALDWCALWCERLLQYTPRLCLFGKCPRYYVHVAPSIAFAYPSAQRDTYDISTPLLLDNLYIGATRRQTHTHGRPSHSVKLFGIVPCVL